MPFIMRLASLRLDSLSRCAVFTTFSNSEKMRRSVPNATANSHLPATTATRLDALPDDGAAWAAGAAKEGVTVSGHSSCHAPVAIILIIIKINSDVVKGLTEHQSFTLPRSTGLLSARRHF